MNWLDGSFHERVVLRGWAVSLTGGKRRCLLLLMLQQSYEQLLALRHRPAALEAGTYTSWCVSVVLFAGVVGGQRAHRGTASPRFSAQSTSVINRKGIPNKDSQLIIRPACPVSCRHTRLPDSRVCSGRCTLVHICASHAELTDPLSAIDVNLSTEGLI